MPTPSERQEVLEVFTNKLKEQFSNLPMRVIKAEARKIAKKFWDDKKAGRIGK